ncbi:nose resistant to fluoxetine protein 6 [Anabrus simplex]|uniref:nose resistant to fluoxetine protein 6 n=1 Tax=Anabrus simplex TaxID=316456 RepID=UPI0035A30C03
MPSIAVLLLSLAASSSVLVGGANDLPGVPTVSTIQRIIAGVPHHERAVNSSSTTDQKTLTAEDILPLLPRNLSQFLPAINQIRTQHCREQTEEFLFGLHNLTSWAVKMFDSAGKVPSGVLSGSTYSLGNFDECVNVVAPVAGGHFQGKYCLARILLTGMRQLNSVEQQPSSVWQDIKDAEERRAIPKDTIHLAFCIPSACSGGDLQEFLTSTMQAANSLSTFRVDVEVEESMCQVKKEMELDDKDIAFISVMAFFLLLLSISSVYDFITTVDIKEKGSTPPSVVREALLAFSVPRNMKKLVKYTPTEDTIDCIFGIKFYAMLLILIGHCSLFRSGGPVLNADFFQKAQMKFENSLLFNNQLFVDTFLLVSGFLFCYHLFKELDKRKSINVPVLYIFRFIRLSPAYIVVIAFYASVFYKLDSGPFWEARVGLERERCLESWWTNVLYINNYVKTESVCMFQSWYIAVDTHLFLLAPLIIIPLHRRPFVGQALLMVLMISSIVIPFVVTYVQSLDPLLMFYSREIVDISTNYTFVTAYIKTHMRATPYFCGILLGYILIRFQASGQKLSKTMLFCGWAIGSLCAISALFSVTAFYSPNYQYSSLDAAIFAAWDKVGWCVGSSWLIFACCTNNGGPLHRLLTWRPVVPLSRLTYCAYLVNGIIELHGAGTQRTPAYLSILDYAKASLSHAVLTFSCALLLCLAFDSPIHALQTALLKRERRKNSGNAEIKENGSTLPS